MKDLSKKSVAVITLFIVISIAAVNTKMNRDEWRRKLLSVRAQLEIGMPRTQAFETIRRLWPEENFSSERGEVRTPLEFGASNWSLLLDFDDNKLAAIAVRADDSLLRLPSGAPDDIVQPKFRPWWDKSRLE